MSEVEALWAELIDAGLDLLPLYLELDAACEALDKLY